VKFLLTWWWKEENAQKVTERFMKWKPVGDVKFLFPIHTIIGANKAFCVTEGVDPEQIARNIQPWTDICTFDISPIMDSREILALLRK
jgi:hypothetical protein